MCMPVLCSNQRNCELMSRATSEQRRNNWGSYCVAFTTASQHCANVNWHWTYIGMIGPMSDISNVSDTNVGPTLNRCSKMMIRRWPNVNPTVGSTIPRWATWHWPNVECQRWSNITDVIGPTLGQRTLAIWVVWPLPVTLPKNQCKSAKSHCRNEGSIINLGVIIVHSVWVWKCCKVQYPSMIMTFHLVSLIQLLKRSSLCYWQHNWWYQHRITKDGWVSVHRNDAKFKLQVYLCSQKSNKVLLES